VRTLRNAFPGAKIHWITSQGPTAFSGVLREATKELIDIVDECPNWLGAKGPGHGVGTFGIHPPVPHPLAPSFDLLIDTRNRWREALSARKIPHKLFLASATRFLFSDRRPSLFRARPTHLCDRLLQYVELAAGYLPPSTGALPVPKMLMQKARLILTEGPIYIGLAPGCSTPIRRWPLERFEQVAHAQTTKGRVPVFILGPLENDIFEPLKAKFPSAIFPLQEFDVWGAQQLTLDHSLAIGRCLNLIVANDSGPGHIMAAVDCPVISLFGPTTPAKAAPRTSRGYCIRAQSFGSAQMTAISWESVDDAVDKMLKHS
jgi:ADP-heptose:LPS heptosyltransferase